MTSLRGALAALFCVVAWATPAQAQQAPLGGGAWSWFGDPRAVHHGGRTFVGWVDLEGDIKVSSYEHATGNRVTAVLQARLNKDDHANPSIHVRPDGHLVVFYSRHVGPAMHYRVSSQPGSVRSWEPPRTVPTNVPGRFGYTYPNPIRLADEARTYLFWRGGNYNPTYSIQNDGFDSWSAARNLILMPGERPYTKYAASGGDTIHVAYTDAHPAEFGDVNIYYARVRGGRIERAGGQQIGTLGGTPISPDQGDLIFSERSWVHDVAADASGRPVIVFASLPSASDHRYHYARWTGTAWQVNEMTRAGGSFRGDGGSPFYSGGLTLDHEDPSRVYLSRQVGEGVWQVEVWTTASQGATWTSQVISGPGKNVRPVSPRGMNVFGGDLSVIWMLGRYDSWVDYGTSIVSLAGGTNAPPVADAEPAVRSGPAPLEVRFDGSFSHDSEGPIASWGWNFGDGALGSGEEATHAYTTAGRYFPSLTVTDSAGATSTLVEEIVVGLPSAPTTHTGGASGVTAHGAIDPENQPTQWSFEYGPTADYGAVTEAQTLPGADALRQVSAELPGLEPGRLYHYRLVATNDSGTTEGQDRVLVAGRTPGSDAYRDAVLATSGLASYWRLGELSGGGAGDERGGAGGSFLGRFVLGQPGALGPLGNTAASFDGLSGEVTVPGPALQTNGTLEGWFRWRAGTTALRDNSSGGGNGWLLAFNSAGNLRYRLGGGRDLITDQPIGLVRNGAWHHIVATKEGPKARLYVDGSEVHRSDTGAGTAPAAGPWHVMRNGLHTVFSEGEADEIALYTRPLTAGEVEAHHDRARELAMAPLPPESSPPAAEPPAAGSGLGGGVLGGGGTQSGGGAGAGLGAGPGPQPAGRAFVRGSRVIVRGAADTDNWLTARKRGARWRIADAAAPLRAGAGCRRLDPNTVSCRARGIRRVALYGGEGNDRLAVAGRIRALLVGGPGADRLYGGRLARFVGGAGPDRSFRRP